VEISFFVGGQFGRCRNVLEDGIKTNLTGLICKDEGWFLLLQDMGPVAVFYEVCS
jgi:hypothetical protein